MSRSFRLQAFAAVSVLVIGGLLLAGCYNGFLGSDDNNYTLGALGWINHFPYVGRDHWELRHTVTIPTAISIWIFGLREFAIGLPSILYGALFLVVNTVVGGRILGLGAALISSLLLITTPVFLVLGGYLNSDLAELFFISVAFWAFVIGCERPQSIAPWLACGAAWSLAFLTRETAATFVMLLGLLFVFHPIVPRSRYFLIAAGALPLLLIECASLYAATGAPLYRYGVDFGHTSVDRLAEIARTRARNAIFDDLGNISVNVYLDPVINLLVSQKFGILFWLGGFAAWQLWRKRTVLGDARRPLMLLAGLASTVFLFVALNPRLELLTRYFLPSAWAVSMIAGYWLATLWSEKATRRLAMGAIFAAMGIGMLGLMVENVHLRFGERALASWAARHPGEIIQTDPDTKHRSTFFLRFRQIDPDRVVTTRQPSPGSIVFFSPDGIQRSRDAKALRPHLVEVRPDSSWRELERIAAPERSLIRFGRWLGLDRVLPEELARKLTRPNSTIVVYRIETMDRATHGKNESATTD